MDGLKTPLSIMYLHNWEYIKLAVLKFIDWINTTSKTVIGKLCL